MGKVPGESEMAPWASSNHCAMFKHGYLELIGITNPENFNPWSRFLDRFEGPHITALRCENGEEAYKALSGRIDHFDPPLQRRIEMIDAPTQSFICFFPVLAPERGDMRSLETVEEARPRIEILRIGNANQFEIAMLEHCAMVRTRPRRHLGFTRYLTHLRTPTRQ